MNGVHANEVIGWNSARSSFRSKRRVRDAGLRGVRGNSDAGYRVSR